MGLFIAALVLLVVAVVVFKVAPKVINNSNYRSDGEKKRHAKYARLGAIGVIVAALICGWFSVFVQVPTKDVAVKTTFGAPSGYLSNGAHLKAPWEQVHTMDGAVQTDTHNKGEKGTTCVQVRIAHQIVACANVYIKWQINGSSVDELYRNYREFSNIRDSLVDKNLQAVLNRVFEDYDPLAVDADGNSSSAQLSTLSTQALDQIRTSVGNQLTVSELNVTVLNYDDATQAKINSLQAQVAQTRIAQQAIKTAEKQAQANKTTAESLNQNGSNVLVSACLDELADAISKNYPLPAGFSCWPGGGSAVVVPGASGASK
jgi:regulator of protease activity HflC (stomatin/prohibitin superfamily)